MPTKKKFKKGDICISKFESRSNKSGLVKRNCKVRITSEAYTGVYNVYNIDFKRYEQIGEFYLELDIVESRDKKIDEILNFAKQNND